MDDIPVPLPATPVRFMDRFRAFIRARHLAYRTEKTYCNGVREFIRFNGRIWTMVLSGVSAAHWMPEGSQFRSCFFNAAFSSGFACGCPQPLPCTSFSIGNRVRQPLACSSGWSRNSLT